MAVNPQLDTVLAARLKREHLRHQCMELSVRGATPPVIAKALGMGLRKVHRYLTTMRKKQALDVSRVKQETHIGEAIATYQRLLKQAYSNYAQAATPEMEYRWIMATNKIQHNYDLFLGRVGLIPTSKMQVELTGALEVEWYGDKETSAAELIGELRGVGPYSQPN